jgi:hypothetical protein
VAAVPGLSNVQIQEGFVRADWLALAAEFEGDDEALQALLGKLLESGLPIVHFSEETQDLEEVFMRTTRGIVS